MKLPPPPPPPQVPRLLTAPAFLTEQTAPAASRLRTKAAAAMALPLLLLASGPAGAQVPNNVINIRVSLKVIVDPATGAVPADMNDALLRDSFRDMNRWLAVNWRGYRLQLVDLDAAGNFKRIGSKNDSAGPGKWYATNLKVVSAGSQSDLDNKAFEDTAKSTAANKTAYGWNDTALNIYMNNGGWSSARFPSENRHMVITGYTLLRYDPAPGQTWSDSYKVAGNLLHELGHSFELYHTHENDGIADTATDTPSPNDSDARDEPGIRNGLAQLNYSKNYSALTDSEKLLIDNSANNAMSYHQLFYDNPPTGKVIPDAERFGPTRFVFTPLQMDKWADWANKAPRNVTASGVMRFVDAAAATSGTGTVSTSPIKTLAAAIPSAGNGGGDILLLRPGTYTAATLTKPMTLRATRQGAVTIKKP